MKFTICFLLMCTLSKLNAQELLKVSSPELQADKKIWIYLPDNYGLTEKRFPVLYVVDQVDAAENKWDFEEGLFHCKIKTIVVGIEHNEGFATLDEMDRFLDFVALTLKPVIDKAYQTQTQTLETGLLGAGNAGLLPFYAALKYPKTFGKIACFSPEFGGLKTEISAQMDKTQDFNKTKIYFLGTEKTAENIHFLEYWANTKRCQCKMLNKKTIVKDQTDGEKLWQEGFKKAYLWLF